MQALLIDEEIKSTLETLRDFAEKNPYKMDDLLDIYNGDAPPPGLIDGYWCVIPVGIKVVFTVELQKVNIRHLSVSVNGKFPNPVLVLEIMKHLGFESTDFSTCLVSAENNGTAINVVEQIK